MKSNSVAVVIAGGKSSRMQQDKALLPFGNCASLAQYQCEKLGEIFENVYLSAKSNKFDFDISIIEDNYDDSSPLVALISIFESLELEEVFVLSVDAPFVDKAVISQLYNEAQTSSDIIVVESVHGLEPLCAIYRRTFLKEALIALNKNQHRLQTLFKKLSVQKIKIEDEKIFMNLNFPHEYEEAKERLNS